MTEPNNLNASDDWLDKALDWQAYATIEAMFEADKTGKPFKVFVTQELIDKHKTEAKAAIKQHIQEELRKARINELDILLAAVNRHGYKIIYDLKEYTERRKSKLKSAPKK